MAALVESSSIYGTRASVLRVVGMFSVFMAGARTAGQSSAYLWKMVGGCCVGRSATATRAALPGAVTKNSRWVMQLTDGEQELWHAHAKGHLFFHPSQLRACPHFIV